MDIDDQVFQFVTINRTAKGVPTSLYYDLLKHLPPSKNSRGDKVLWRQAFFIGSDVVSPVSEASYEPRERPKL